MFFFYQSNYGAIIIRYRYRNHHQIGIGIIKSVEYFNILFLSFWIRLVRLNILKSSSKLFKSLSNQAWISPRLIQCNSIKNAPSLEEKKKKILIAAQGNRAENGERPNLVLTSIFIFFYDWMNVFFKRLLRDISTGCYFSVTHTPIRAFLSSEAFINFF